MKRERHEREKEYMGALQGLGSAVGEYAGDGHGELESDSVAQAVVDGVDVNVDDDGSLEQHEDTTDSALFVLYDCETTGLSIYNDHIIEIAAEVVHCPVPNTNLSFSSLVKTSRRIPLPGINQHKKLNWQCLMPHYLVIRVTNITPTMIRGEKPLSVVFKEFQNWLITTTSDISRATGTTYYPGTLTCCKGQFIMLLCPQFLFPIMVSPSTSLSFLLKLSEDQSI